MGLILSPGILMVGVWWDGNPYSVAVTVPFMHLWCEHEGGSYWRWDWTILRIVIGRQEFRTDLTFNDWGLGVVMHQIDDWSIHFGPIDIECEYDNFYDDDLYTQHAAHLRLFSKVRQPC